MSDLVGLWCRFPGQTRAWFFLWLPVVGGMGMVWQPKAEAACVAAGGPAESSGKYRVLAPIESGRGEIFFFVSGRSRPVAKSRRRGGPFSHPGRGVSKNGSVEVIEAGQTCADWCAAPPGD